MNAFRNKLLSGAEMVGFEVDLCDPCISEMIGQMGYDYLWIDTEHEAMDYQTVLMHIIAARAAGTASVVRIPQNEPFLAKRVLEMGPDGIIFPMISTAATCFAARCNRLTILANSFPSVVGLAVWPCVLASMGSDACS